MAGKAHRQELPNRQGMLAAGSALKKYRFNFKELSIARDGTQLALKALSDLLGSKRCEARFERRLPYF
jgi:hypothetical protein